MRNLHFVKDMLSIFDQIDDVSIGSPLVSIMTYLFMGFHEKDSIEKAQAVKPLFYKRHVDNIFVVFVSELNVETFYSHFKAKHKNIKFTYEKQFKNKLFI